MGIFCSSVENNTDRFPPLGIYRPGYYMMAYSYHKKYATPDGKKYVEVIRIENAVCKICDELRNNFVCCKVCPNKLCLSCTKKLISKECPWCRTCLILKSNR
jgi:hypothetical protein